MIIPVSRASVSRIQANPIPLARERATTIDKRKSMFDKFNNKKSPEAEQRHRQM